MGKNILLKKLFFIFPMFFLTLFFVFPLLNILIKSFFLNADFLTLLVQTFFKNQKLFFNSFYQAFFSAIVATFIGLPSAYFVSKYDFKAKKVLKSLSFIPFVIPSIIVALAFVILFGNNGLINRFLIDLFLLNEPPLRILYSFNGIILAHAFYNFPIIMRLVSSSWETLDEKMQFAASTLGANPLQVFRKITLLQLLPSILAGFALVFIYCFMSFAIVLTLGGVEFSTVEVGIYQTLTRDINISAGIILSLIQFVVLFFVLLVYNFISKKFLQKRTKIIVKKKHLTFSTLKGKFSAFFIFFIFLFSLLPLLAILLFSFRTRFSGFSFENFAKLFETTYFVTGVTPLTAIFNSLFFAFSTALIVVPLALMFSVARKNNKNILTESFALASIAVSSVSLGLGFIISFQFDSLFLIILAHSVIAFPFAFKTISNSLDSIKEETLFSAQLLGADFKQYFSKILIPLLKPALIVSFAFSFAISLGELALVLMLYNGELVTMPLYIYRLVSSFRFFEAAAMGVVLIFLSFFSFYLIERFSKNSTVF